MTAAILCFLVLVATLVLAFGRLRLRVPRQPSFEGVEDPQVAEAYDRISGWPQFRLLRHMIVTNLGRYKPSGILADIGCGPGHLAILIAQKHPRLHILGLDTADEVIRAAASKASSLALSDRLEFRTSDVGDLPLPSASLDFAVSTLSLHHWSEPRRGLAEIHRALKPQGQFLMFDLRRDVWRLFYWMIRFAQALVVPKALRRAGEPLGSLLASYTRAELQELLAFSPFREWKIECGPVWAFVWARKA